MFYTYYVIFVYIAIQGRFDRLDIGGGGGPIVVTNFLYAERSDARFFLGKCLMLI